jgi:DNA ligase-1
MVHTLYGKSQDGKIKFWTVEIKDSGEILFRYGYLGSENIQETVRYCVPKNIGKSNETTHLEQAISEANSLINKKLDEGYSYDISSIPEPDKIEYFLPMLAQKDKDKYIKYPAYVQPKLDGVRMISKKIDGEVLMWSRKGKKLDVPVEIKTSLDNLLSEGESFDGELYVHGWTFQRIISAVKKYSTDTKVLEYHIYDVPDGKKTFRERFVDGVTLNFNNNLFSNIKFVETSFVESPEDIVPHLDHFLALKYEGLMIRNSESYYIYKHRSNDLQKVKKFDDDEFKVINVIEATGRDAGTAIFVCETSSGSLFNVRPKGSLEERKYYLDNKDYFIGKMLTVKYQGFTDGNIPRFGVGLHFRPEWDL